MGIIDYGLSEYHYKEKLSGKVPNDFEQTADAKLIKAQLAILINEYRIALNLNQHQVAALTGFSRRKISDCMNGQFDRITLNEILDLLIAICELAEK